MFQEKQTEVAEKNLSAHEEVNVLLIRLMERVMKKKRRLKKELTGKEENITQLNYTVRIDGSVDQGKGYTSDPTSDESSLPWTKPIFVKT